MADKSAYISGAEYDPALEHSAVPYDVRKQMYEDYLQQKAKEQPTGYLKSMGIHGGLGAGTGALLGALLGSSNRLGGAGIGAGVGGAIGLLGGAQMAHQDKEEIAKARSAISTGTQEQALARQIAAMVDERDRRRSNDQFLNTYMANKLSSADELANNLPDEVKIAIERFGFGKLAAAVYGVDEINEKTAAQIIGVKLAQRLNERREIKLGIQALGELVR